MFHTKFQQLLASSVVLLLASASAQANDYALEPIKTESAKIQDAITLSFSWETFEGMELDEVEDFNGWTMASELVWPFLDKFQIRFKLPLRTDGDAQVKPDNWIVPGMPIDVEGNGGVYDFITAQFEHQLMFEAQHDYNLSYYLGGGAVGYPLDTNLPRPGSGTDAINHNGTVFLLGVKADTQRDDMHWLGNAGFRWYEGSDDLNPSNNDQFLALDLKAAVVFAPWGNHVYPVIEATYLGDFSDLNQIAIIPELLFPINSHVELKAGASIGLGGSGSEYGAQTEISIRF